MLVLFLFCLRGTAQADVVGLLDSQKIMFQHPNFDEATRILIFLRNPIEGNVAQLLVGETDPERKNLIMKYSEQVSAFAEMDSTFLAETDLERKNALWAERQNKFTDFEASLMEPIMADCRNAVQEVMKRRQMTALIEVDAAYYGGMDITDEVIEQIKRGK